MHGATLQADVAPGGSALRGRCMMKVHGAAISMQGVSFAVVVVGMELVKNPGEADMAIERLGPAFGEAPVVLMAQKEDGTPTYYGDQKIVELLRGVPIDQMPWKEYSVPG